MNLANAIVIAFVAGLASATLGAAAISGPGLGLFFVLIAPLPLMIVAFRWHPLLALLGGLLTAAAIALFIRGGAALTYSVLVTGPAYLVGTLFWGAAAPERTRVGLMCLATAACAVLATLIGCLSISFSHDELEAQLLRQSEAVYRFMSGIGRDAPLTAPGGGDPQLFIRAYANAVPPLSCAMLAFVYMFNVWLGARIAHKSNPLGFTWTPIYTMRLPRIMLGLSAGALIGGLMPGYPGLALELVGAASLVCLVVLGYAAAHHATVGTPTRGFALTGLWIATLVFGLPAAFMLLAGIAELTFGWREKIVARRTLGN
jgi:hypothetical protein